MTPMLARIGTAASALLMGRLPVAGLTGGGADMATIKPSRAEPSRAALPASSWWRRLRRSASRSESSASAGRRSDTRRPASSPDSFDSSPARAAAAACAAARNLRRGLLPALLCLPVLLGLAAPAAAQTTPTISPSTLIEDWGLNQRSSRRPRVNVRNIPSSWTAPVDPCADDHRHRHRSRDEYPHTAIAAKQTTFNISVDTYDVCDDQGTGYNCGRETSTISRI